MSRTYRKPPIGGMFIRCPRGNKRALIYAVRHGAVPPSAWEDIPPQDEVWLAWKIADRMLSRGDGPEAVERAIVDKFGISHREARRIVLRQAA